MKSPPVVGQMYSVPCVLGTLSNIGPHNIPPKWWPVLTPSHQDSIYFARYRTVWQETDNGYEDVDEVYYEDDLKTPHHYHVDPRFTTEDYYTPYEIAQESFHTTIRPESEISVRDMVCVREMPIQTLFTGFGKNFLDDHKEARLKLCGRCPHKGISLTSMPMVDGKITCPAHGLQFDSVTGRCVSEWIDK